MNKVEVQQQRQPPTTTSKQQNSFVKDERNVF